MESVKEKSAEVRGFKGSITAREKIGAIGSVEEPAEGLAGVIKGASDIVEGKARATKENPKAKPKAKAKKEPKAIKEKRAAKAKISVAISPGDLDLLQKVAKKAGKSVSLFVAECIAERVR